MVAPAMAEEVKFSLVLTKKQMRILAQELEWMCTATEDAGVRKAAAKAAVQLFMQLGHEKMAETIRKTQDV